MPGGCENIQSFIVTPSSMKCISAAVESLLWGTNTNTHQMAAVMAFDSIPVLPGRVFLERDANIKEHQ